MKTQEFLPLLLAAVVAGCGGGDGDTPAAALPTRALTAQTTATLEAMSQVAPIYALDFVGTAATGFDLNDAGDVVGKSYTDPDCGPFCLPAQENVVWKGGQRTVLPPVAGLSGLSSYYAGYINNLGTVAGAVGFAGGSHAVRWNPVGTGYVAQDLGVLPGTSSAAVFGLDDQDRLVGWATSGGAIPSVALPFMWSPGSGLVNLKTQGYPNEMPAAMSPGGKVVTTNSWYQLGDPASAVPLPPMPRGFMGAGSNGSAINDAGDQAHFLVSTSSQNLVYPFRLSSGGTWQQISNAGSGSMSRYRMGSISAGQDVTFTALNTGMVAPGPAGTGQLLSDRISPAYPGAAVVDGGPMNAEGQILAQVMVGRSQRLVKLTPATACTTNCLVSRTLAMTGQFVQDPALPGACVEGGKMYNLASATVTITSETGAALGNVQVSGRFLDDYWTDRPVTGTTNASGVVSWSHKGLCGVGAIAFLVDSASLGTRSFDRTRGTLSGYVIPGTADEPAPAPAPEPAPPTNQAPIPVADVTCAAGKICTFSAADSDDPDGSIAAYKWAENKGTVWSTLKVFTRTFSKAGKESVVLHVTDNAGLSASKKVMFTVLR